MIRLALAQVNFTVGDLDGNVSRIRETIREAEGYDADVVCFPELALCGYPPEDLVLKRDFLEECEDALRRLTAEVGETTVILGTLHYDGDLFNAAAVLRRGEVAGWYHKNLLPNYGVFDEARYFAPGEEGLVLETGGVRVGITICEDIWFPGGPLEGEVASGGADLVVNISHSPYHRGKRRYRERMLSSRSEDAVAVLAYVNGVGGQDELVFDGGSMVLHPEKGVIAVAPPFREHLLLIDVDVSGLRGRRLMTPVHRHFQRGALRGPTRVLDLGVRSRAPGGERHSLPPARVPEERGEEEEEVLQALLLGLGDYFRKNGFREAVIGLSGGVDSSLVAVLAAMALGRERVHGVFMPSRHTSELSRQCVERLVSSLGIDMEEYPIDGILQAYLRDAAASLQGKSSPLALENLQARIRGNILMSISNARGWLVLATGNKSELSMGYCTLYGDMAGGFAVIKDLLKRDVYGLCRYINRREGREVIPEVVISREPTAELREGQRDSDSLPPYEVLDPILEDYIENGLTVEEMVRKGYRPELVEEIVRRVDANEYKRRQAPVGIKITPRAFGRDWRLPITVSRPGG